MPQLCLLKRLNETVQQKPFKTPMTDVNYSFGRVPGHTDDRIGYFRGDARGKRSWDTPLSDEIPGA
jgi:hypothetical protein